MNYLQMIWEGFVLMAAMTVLISLVVAFTPEANADDYSIIHQINSDANKVPYVDDVTNYGKSMYNKPEDFYKNGGDCKDYVIAKHAKLRAAGISDDRMKLIYANNPNDEFHMMIMVDDRVLDIGIDEPQPMSYLEDFKHITIVAAEVIYKLEVL